MSYTYLTNNHIKKFKQTSIEAQSRSSRYRLRIGQFYAKFLNKASFEQFLTRIHIGKIEKAKSIKRIKSLECRAIRAERTLIIIKYI